MLPPSESGDVNFTVAENPSSSKPVTTASWFECNSYIHRRQSERMAGFGNSKAWGGISDDDFTTKAVVFGYQQSAEAPREGDFSLQETTCVRPERVSPYQPTCRHHSFTETMRGVRRTIHCLSYCIFQPTVWVTPPNHTLQLTAHNMFRRG